ncbi:uncharacterized protein LOC144918826 isoform X2 [Branchiostoma floridae x Branchiostoma belcheri]
MRPVTVGLVVVCVLTVLVHWHGASGVFSSGRRRAVVSSSRRRSPILVPSTSRRRSLTNRVVRTGVRLVATRLLSSGRRRRSRRYRSNDRQYQEQCQQCTPGYVSFDPVTNKYRLLQYGTEDAQLMKICRSGSAACSGGRCSLNYLYSNGTITDFPDNIGGADPYVGRISNTLESVLICGTLRHAASLQVTLLALAAVAAAMWLARRD